MSEAEAGNAADNDYTFQIMASPDEVTPLIAKGEVDIAAAPANLAATLYNKNDGSVRAIAINTLGVLYICELGDTVHSVEDLRGKTVISSGKGSTTEYGLAYVLEKNGLAVGEDVTVEWKSEHAECVAALAASSGDAVALLPQPFVTTAQAQNDQLPAWRSTSPRSGTASRPATRGAPWSRAWPSSAPSSRTQAPAAVDAFLAHYAESVDFVNENVDEAAELVGSYDIVPAQVAKKAIPECNIVCVTGEEMKGRLSGYLQALADQNPEAVGGAVPGDDFYYGA